MTVPQDRASGAAANAWGRRTARRVAELIGAEPVNAASNECLLDHTRIVIKCAHRRTLSVGVTFKMLDRLDQILGAFQADGKSFDLVWLDRERYRVHMTSIWAKASFARLTSWDPSALAPSMKSYISDARRSVVARRC